MREICKPINELPWRLLWRMLHVLTHDEWHWHCQKAARLCNKKMINIAIRSTYFIFCCRNRNWDSPDFWFFFVFDFFSFLFFKMFWIIQSQAHCKMKRAYLAPKMGPKRVWQKNPHAKNFYLLLHFTYLIQIQQRLREIFKEPPLISYRRGKSLKDLLVRAKLWRSYYFQYDLVQGSCDARRLFLTI